MFNPCLFLGSADESYLTNGYLDTPIDWIAGMPTVRLGDISSFVRTVEPNGFGLREEEEEAALAVGKLPAATAAELREEVERKVAIADGTRRREHGGGGLGFSGGGGGVMRVEEEGI